MAGPRLLMGVVLLLVGFACVAYSSSRSNAVTYDESLHLTSAYFVRHYSDFRVNPEDPPLFQRWAGLGLPAGSLTPDLSAEALAEVEAVPANHWRVAVTALYSRPYEEIRPYVDRARLLMVVLGVALGGVMMALTWSVAGRGPAVVATVLAGVFYCFDPTILGHAPLVKNDIALGLAFCVTTLGCVLLSERVTWGRVLLVAVGAGIGVTTKFSGLLLGPAVAIALVARALSSRPWGLLPAPWTVVRWQASTRWSRLGVAAGVCLFCSVFCFVAVWGVYGFRYSMTVDPDRPLVLETEDGMAQANLGYLRHWSSPTTQQAIAEPIPLPMRVMRGVAERKLLPAAYCKGFNYTYATTVLRNSFLLGEQSVTGWWYYFPLTLLFKLPLATLVFLLSAGVLVLWRPKDGGVLSGRMMAPALIAGFYLFTAVTGSFNLGIRHLLPVLPILYSMAAVVIGTRLPGILGWSRQGRGMGVGLVVVPGLVLGLLVTEVLWRYPRYISFFNAPARACEPARLLGDSNLDWGQDLLLLADWQRANPGVEVSLGYFGSMNPVALGLRFTSLPGTLYSGQPVVSSPPHGVVAISTSHLQGLAARPSELGTYDIFRKLKPREVLGDTIYLYNWPPTREDLSDRPMPLSLRKGRNVTVVTSPVPSGKR